MPSKPKNPDAGLLPDMEWVWSRDHRLPKELRAEMLRLKASNSGCYVWLGIRKDFEQKGSIEYEIDFDKSLVRAEEATFAGYHLLILRSLDPALKDY